MSTNTSLLRAVSAVSILAAGAMLISTQVQSADFSAKKVNLTVPLQEGGGSDHYARLFAPFMSQHLPGKPTLLVMNKPGGGGVKASNWFERSGKKDGSDFMVVSTSNLTGMVLGGTKIKYNLNKWRFIMLSPKGTVVYALPRTGATGKDIVADVKAMRKVVMKHGAKNPTSAELRSFMAFDMLGFKIKPVFGLSTGKQRKAILRGELDINYDSADAYLSKAHKYVKKGTIVQLMTLGYFANGKIGRDPAFPELPTFPEVYEKVTGKKPAGPMWDTYQHFFHMGVTASKAFALPPGTPDSILNTYVTAAKATVNDPKFKKIALKTLGTYEQSFGKDAQEVIKFAVDISPASKAFMAKWIKEQFDVNI
ncbi:MAG: hypothetical protein RIB59_00645 [Rhodospirillales bacterium]